MKSRLVCVLIVLALFAMLLSGCSSGGNKNQPEATTAPTKAQQAAAEATEPVEVEPTTAPEPTSEPEAEELEESEQVLFSELDDLAQLDSYRVNTSIRWEEPSGETGSMDLTIEFTREPMAQRMIVSNIDNDVVENMEIISIGNTTYMKAGGDEWFALQSEDTSVQEVGQIWSPEDFLAGGDAELIGTETINGIQTKHYRYKESAFGLGAGFSSIEKATGEVWVSTEYNVYVKALLHIEGGQVQEFL